VQVQKCWILVHACHADVHRPLALPPAQVPCRQPVQPLKVAVPVRAAARQRGALSRLSILPHASALFCPEMFVEDAAPAGAQPAFHAEPQVGGACLQAHAYGEIRYASGAAVRQSPPPFRRQPLFCAATPPPVPPARSPISRCRQRECQAGDAARRRASIRTRDA